MSTVKKPKKSVDDQISDEIKKLGSLFERKFSNSKMSDTEKSFARIVSNAIKQKQEGKGSKSEKKISDEVFAFARKEKPFKEDIMSMISTLVRASLDAQSKPVQPKTKPSS